MKDIRKQLEDVALEDPEGGVNVCLEDAIEVVKQRDKDWREKIREIDNNPGDYWSLIGKIHNLWKGEK